MQRDSTEACSQERRRFEGGLAEQMNRVIPRSPLPPLFPHDVRRFDGPITNDWKEADGALLIRAEGRRRGD